MNAEKPQVAEGEFWSQGLDRAFFARAYRRAGAVGCLAALLLMGLEQRPGALGMLCGVGVGLFSVWSVEATVRLLFKGGGVPGLNLGVAVLLKLPLLLPALLGIAWAGDRGFLNIFAVVAGVMLVHGTLLVLTISAALSSDERRNDWYR